MNKRQFDFYFSLDDAILIKSNLNDLCRLKGKVRLVAATVRVGNLYEIVINQSEDEKRRLKSAAVLMYNLKSLNLD